MALQTLFKDAEDKMAQAVAAVKRGFSEIRGGRATPALVEHVTVDYYGAATPLKQVAAITAPEPRLLVIQPWDAKLVAEIEKAVQKSGLGITPMVDGKIVRLPVPPLTGDRRAELTKLIHKLAEEGRVSIRSTRRDANEAIKKLKSQNQATEDDVFTCQEQTQKLTDKYIGQIDALVKAKEQELQSV
jgi:ribosome recycling factor